MNIKYKRPPKWISYDPARIIAALSDAKAGVLSLTNVPYQKAWAERLQEVQLKQEVAGTSRIEGAEFTDSELTAAIGLESAEEAMTRSQLQARAAVNTYRWISRLPDDRPINEDLILEIHRRIVTGCDDDHCPPGVLRPQGNNVTFGRPPHRGSEGGDECQKAFRGLMDDVQGEFKEHDILIRALSLHYHIGAMHPFYDGNGRTARAVEALILQRAGLRDALFIALSNYYYDEKLRYLKNLASVIGSDGDMTDFLIFGLEGIAKQCNRLLGEINRNISKALFRDIAGSLFEKLLNPRRRVIAIRQLAIIHYLLEHDETDAIVLFKQLRHSYKMKETWPAFVRDINALLRLEAIRFIQPDSLQFVFGVRLEWPTEITETKFFESTKDLPRAKTFHHY